MNVSQKETFPQKTLRLAIALFMIFSKRFIYKLCL